MRLRRASRGADKYKPERRRCSPRPGSLASSPATEGSNRIHTSDIHFFVLSSISPCRTETQQRDDFQKLKFRRNKGGKPNSSFYSIIQQMCAEFPPCASTGSRVMTKKAGNRSSVEASQSNWGDRHKWIISIQHNKCYSKGMCNVLR